jgi:glycosyltransferase involved in cell wall biosynthesis
MMRVLVLLSTFNGANHLQAAINSILSQEGVLVSILVRDDGSSDDTIEIVKKMADKRVMLMVSDNHLGVVRSYKMLIEESLECSADFIALADQDDIWLSNKLINAIKLLESEEKHLYSSARFILKDENISEFPYPAETVKQTLANNLFENIHANCTMVMSKRFIQSVISSQILCNASSIDHTLVQYALIVNEHVYDPNSYILYRLHENNHIGMNSKLNIYTRIRSMLVYRNQLRHLISLNIVSHGENFDLFLQLQNLKKRNLIKYHLIRSIDFRRKYYERSMVRLFLLFSRFPDESGDKL